MVRPVRIILTPDAIDANGLSVAETLVSARLTMLIGGALQTGIDPNGICEAQTPSAAADLAIDGVLAGSGGLSAALLDETYGQYVTITSNANDTDRTFTITGVKFPEVKVFGAAGSTTETITGPGNGLTVIGSTLWARVTNVAISGAGGEVQVGVNGYWTNPTPQHLTILSAVDDSGKTFTITGIDREGVALSEDIVGSAGGPGTALGTKNFAVVQKIVISAASANNVSIGVNGLCESRWIILDRSNRDFNVGLGVSLSGTATYAVQHTFENVFDLGEDGVTAHTHSTLTGQTANADGNYTNPAFACRLDVTAHTSGTVTLNVIQAGS